MKRRGKYVALSTAAVGLVVLVAAAFAVRPLVVERYYLRQLQAPDEDARLRAAKTLAELRSVRAVPHLIRLISREEREYVWSLYSLDGRVFTVGLKPSRQQTKCEERLSMTPLAYSLYRIGAGALPGLVEAEQPKLLLLKMHRNEDFALIRSQIVRAINSPDLIITRVTYEQGGMAKLDRMLNALNTRLEFAR